MKIRSALSALLAFSTLASVACDDDDEDPIIPPVTATFTANLTGAAEVPPVTTAATGTATFTAVTSGATTTITYTATVTGLSGPATAAHIHGPANTSASANPIVTLTVTGTGTSGNIISGSFTTTGHATINMAQLLAHIEAGNAYINIHTAANINGEIRGQLN